MRINKLDELTSKIVITEKQSALTRWFTQEIFGIQFKYVFDKNKVFFICCTQDEVHLNLIISLNKREVNHNLRILFAREIPKTEDLQKYKIDFQPHQIYEIEDKVTAFQYTRIVNSSTAFASFLEEQLLKQMYLSVLILEQKLISANKYY